MSIITEHALGLLGKRTKKKVLVIESDDWGLMRMPSIDAFLRLKDNGIPVHTCKYNLYDSLETHEDISVLSDFCDSFQDVRGNPLKITANYIMANPDFEAIQKTNFHTYYYDDVETTYNRYQGSNDTLKAVKDAISQGFMRPQLHGREHLQVNAWLEALREGCEETLLAFNSGIYGHPSSYAENTGVHFLSAYHTRNKQELEFAGHSVKEAASIFEKTFGFISKTFIAPRYIWPSDMEPYFSEAGIRALQGTSIQLQPVFNDPSNKLKRRFNWLGKKNSDGLLHITRNVFFEPTEYPSFAWEADALRRIDTAFFWGKPAILSMHRLNFMGGFKKENSLDNLNRLRIVLNEMQRRHKDVVFATSDELLQELI